MNNDQRKFIKDITKAISSIALGIWFAFTALLFIYAIQVFTTQMITLIILGLAIKFISLGGKK